MPFPTTTRRGAMLLAASTIGLSAALTAVPGTASAATAPVHVTSSATLTVPAGTCSVDVVVVGGSGGASAAATGGRGASVSFSYVVTGGQELYLGVGPAGQDAADGGSGGAEGAGMGGTGGAGAGGGGMSSWVSDVTHDLVLVSAGGGGGAGSAAGGGDAAAAGHGVGDATTTVWAAGGGAGSPTAAGRGGALGAGAVDGAAGEDGGADFGGSGAAAGGGGGGTGWYPGGGGAAAGPLGGGAGGGGGASHVATAAGLTPAADQPALAVASGDGHIDYLLQACTAPGAPSVNPWVDQMPDGPEIAFHPRADDPARVAPVTGWQYTLDGGATWSTLTERLTGGSRHAGSLPTDLVPQQRYQIAVRAQSAVGPGAASATVDYVVPMRAPADVRIAVGTSSVTLSWGPPPGAVGVTGYGASVIPVGHDGDDEDNINCPELDGSARTCTIGVPAGVAYTAYVQAYDGAGGAGFGATVDSEVVPGPAIPSVLPAASGPLGTGAADAVLAGGDTLTLAGDGFAPYSTVQFVVYSSPVSLGTANADYRGEFSAPVTLPAGLVGGEHHLVATGIDPSGAVRNLVATVTVDGPGEEVAAAPSGTGGSTSGHPTGDTLAYTGAAVTPYLVGGAVALVVGTGLVIVGRRRRTA